MEDIININEYIRDCEGNIERIINVINGDLYLGEYGNSYPRNCIAEHSFNIIGLIEVGDYVNGHIVEDLDDLGYITLDNDNIKYDDIKNIVTKEMFNSIKYEV